MRRIAFFLILIPLLSAGIVQAGSITMTFVGAAPNGANDGSYYVSPYQGKLGNEVVPLYCLDFYNEVHWNQVWKANLSLITDTSDLSLTRFGGLVGSGSPFSTLAEARTAYQKAAWLITKLPAKLDNSSTTWDTQVDIQHAIWHLFDLNAPITLDPDSLDWLNQAAEAAKPANHFYGTDFSRFWVVTNTDPLVLQRQDQVQEFLTIVPEPASLLLLGTGLLWVGRRFRLRAR